MKAKRKPSATKSVASAKRKAKRVRLSGWQYEKRRREKRVEETRKAQAAIATYIERRVTKLQSIDDCISEYEQLYNAVGSGTLLPEDATKRAWIIDKAVGALDKREVEKLRIALEQMNNADGRVLQSINAQTQHLEG